MSLILDGTNGVSDIDGSAATPAIRGTDTNTGIFFPAADTIAFAEGGAEVARFDSSGNLGVGTTSPSHRLNVRGVTNTDVQVRIQANASNDYNSILSFGDNVDDSGLILYSNFSNHMRFDTNNTERMRISSAGLVGIGTSSPSGLLHVSGGVNTFERISNTTNSVNIDFTAASSVGYLGTSSNHATGFTTNDTERMRIDTSGNLLVAKTSTSTANSGVQIYGGATGAMTLGTTGTSGAPQVEFFRGTNGSLSRVGFIETSGSGTTYSTSSDYRLKENIAPMTGALAKVEQLKPVTYKWKSTGEESQGFIAHELQAVVPDCVTGEKDGMQTQQYEVSPAIPATFDEEGNELTPAVEAVMGEREVPEYQGIDTSFLVATLTAAIQEQQAMITSLTARIVALEGAAV